MARKVKSLTDTEIKKAKHADSPLPERQGGNDQTVGGLKPIIQEPSANARLFYCPRCSIDKNIKLNIC